MKTRLGVGGLLLASIILAGCGSVGTVQLRTAAAPAQACMDALASGTLVVSNASGLALRTEDGTVMEVLWPFGYSARRDGGRLVLLDDQRNLVAREGQGVQVSGGMGGNNLWEACAGSISVVPGQN